MRSPLGRSSYVLTRYSSVSVLRCRGRASGTWLLSPSSACVLRGPSGPSRCIARLRSTSSVRAVLFFCLFPLTLERVARGMTDCCCLIVHLVLCFVPPFPPLAILLVDGCSCLFLVCVLRLYSDLSLVALTDGVRQRPRPRPAVDGHPALPQRPHEHRAVASDGRRRLWLVVLHRRLQCVCRIRVIQAVEHALTAERGR